MAKHTPGPWKVIKPGHGAPTKYKSVQFGKDEMYASMEMLPADARLVAAAPDLLAACEAALSRCQVYDMLCNCGKPECATTMLRAAVRKATGSRREPRSIAQRRVAKRDAERRNALVLKLLECKNEAATLGLFGTVRAIDDATTRIGWEIGDQLSRGSREGAG